MFPVQLPVAMAGGAYDEKNLRVDSIHTARIILCHVYLNGSLIHPLSDLS